MARSNSRSAAALGNSVVSAVEQAAALYRVPCYRMQSRVFTVPGNGGKDRPMFVGEWVDRNGVRHTKGKADLLLTPRVEIHLDPAHPNLHTHATVPLWVECKAGASKLTPEQRAFRDEVLAAAAYYIECRDSADPVLAWFEAHGVTR